MCCPLWPAAWNVCLPGYTLSSRRGRSLPDLPADCPLQSVSINPPSAPSSLSPSALVSSRHSLHWPQLVASHDPLPAPGALDSWKTWGTKQSKGLALCTCLWVQEAGIVQGRCSGYRWWVLWNGEQVEGGMGYRLGGVET